MIHEKLAKSYESFKLEAETFFVSKFITSPTIDSEICNSIDIIFDVTKTVDSNRGLIAFSQKYGQGKSFFFDVLDHWFFRRKEFRLFKRTTAKELAALYSDTTSNEDPQKRLDDFIKVRNLFIDDIGDEGENKTFHNYSNSLNVLRYVLLKRYEYWNEKGWKTYGTTNLTIEQIASNYDGRVADRVLQMCHWREFTFLKSGSFRQVAETRKLNKSEIEKNAIKFQKPETPVERVNMEKYFNDLIAESDEYLSSQSLSFWDFVKVYLLEKGLLNQKDFDKKLTDEKIKYSEIMVKEETREYQKSKLKHAPTTIRNNSVKRAIEAITKKQIINTAESIIAKEKFMELRKKKHVFTNDLATNGK